MDDVWIEGDYDAHVRAYYWHLQTMPDDRPWRFQYDQMIED